MRVPRRQSIPMRCSKWSPSLNVPSGWTLIPTWCSKRSRGIVVSASSSWTVIPTGCSKKASVMVWVNVGWLTRSSLIILLQPLPHCNQTDWVTVRNWDLRRPGVAITAPAFLGQLFSFSIGLHWRLNSLRKSWYVIREWRVRSDVPALSRYGIKTNNCSAVSEKAKGTVFTSNLSTTLMELELDKWNDWSNCFS